MAEQERISLFDLVFCISDLLDLVSEDVANHHKRVAYIADSLACELGLSGIERNDLLVAGALHDLGAFSLQQRLDALSFELSFELDNQCEHAELGYLLLKKYAPFSRAAELVRCHHIYWINKDLVRGPRGEINLGTHILHLADRIDVLIDKHREILGQVEEIKAKIKEKSGLMFAPQLVGAFNKIAQREHFWFELTSRSLNSSLVKKYRAGDLGLDLEGLLDLSRFLAQIVDMRSSFTATHSWGVAAAASELGRFMGLSPVEVKRLKIAGYLHDLGKLAVPPEIINQPGSLTRSQYNMIKSHVFYTHDILKNIKGLGVISDWASFHHERLDGSGYPFHYKGEELSLGARIVALADVFTALTEDRPYREGMTKKKALGVIDGLVENGAVDAQAVSVLKSNYDSINLLRIAVQEEANETYREFREQVQRHKMKKQLVR